MSVVSVRAVDQEAMKNFNSLKGVQHNMAYTASQLKNSGQSLQKDFEKQPMSNQDFNKANQKFRELLMKVTENEAPNNLTKIMDWINSKSQKSMVLEDAGVQVKKAYEHLKDFIKNAQNLNKERSEALNKPLTEKSETVKDQVDKFVENLPTLDHVKEELDGAVFDFQTYVKQ